MSIVTITVSNDADFNRTFQYMTGGDFPMPIDLAGSSMEMMLRRRAEDEVALLRLATATGEIVYTDTANGYFTVLIKQEVLERLGLGDFEHSLILTRGESKTEVWSGTFTNNAGPTR